jgi:hypothetical protein
MQKAPAELRKTHQKIKRPRGSPESPLRVVLAPAEPPRLR